MILATQAVDEASTVAERARLELGSSQQLLGTGAIAWVPFDDAAAASRSADARLASSRETLHLLQEARGPRTSLLHARRGRS